MSVVCRKCGREVRLRKDGRLPKHATPGQHPDNGEWTKEMCEAGGSEWRG